MNRASVTFSSLLLVGSLLCTGLVPACNDQSGLTATPLTQPAPPSEVAATSIAGYTNSMSEEGLVRSYRLRQAADASSRIAVQYADSIHSIDLRPPEIASSLITTSSGIIVNLYGHRANVNVGEEIILYLTAVNPITSPEALAVQLTLGIPSGWSITSAGFVHGVGGIWTKTYIIEQGPEPKAVNVSILANEPFEGNIVGYVDYYFRGEEMRHREEVTLRVSARAQRATDASARAGDSSDPAVQLSSRLRWVVVGMGFVIAILVVAVIELKRLRKAC